MTVRFWSLESVFDDAHSLFTVVLIFIDDLPISSLISELSFRLGRVPLWTGPYGLINTCQVRSELTFKENRWRNNHEIKELVFDVK